MADVKKCSCCFPFKTFCGCFSLQTGAFGIGVFILCGCLYVFIITLKGLLISDYFAAGDDESKEHGSAESKNSTEVGLYAIQLIISILSIGFAVLALIAAFKNRKHRFLVPWLVWNFFVVTAGTVIMFHSAVSQWIQENIGMGIGFFAATLSILVIGVFFWLTMLSFYLKLRKVDKEKKNTNP